MPHPKTSWLQHGRHSAFCSRLQGGDVCGSCEAPFEFIVGVGEEFIGAQAQRGLQLIGIEIAKRTGLRQHKVGDVAFTGDNFFDAFVDSARADETMSDNGFILTDPPCAISRLVFNGGIPPSVHKG